MQIGGFRIHVIGVEAGRWRPEPERSVRGFRCDDSAVVSRLSWLMLDPEPSLAPPRALGRSVADGSYQVPALAITRRLVEEHLLKGH